MTEITVKGLERFHFWGRYSVDIVLACHSAEDAARILPVLNQVKHPHIRTDACGRSCVPGAWAVSKDPKILMAWVDDADLQAVHKQLEGYGADLKKVGSMSKSVDCGLPFDMLIPVGEYEDPRQLLLPLW